MTRLENSALVEKIYLCFFESEIPTMPSKILVIVVMTALSLGLWSAGCSSTAKPSAEISDEEVDPADWCGGTRTLLSYYWNSERQARIQNAFAATGLPYASTMATRAVNYMDRWASQWNSAIQDQCELPTPDSPLNTDKFNSVVGRRYCYSERLFEFDEIGSELESASIPTVENIESIFPEFEERFRRCADPRVFSEYLYDSEAQEFDLFEQYSRAMAKLRMARAVGSPKMFELLQTGGEILKKSKSRRILADLMLSSSEIYMDARFTTVSGDMLDVIQDILLPSTSITMARYQIGRARLLAATGKDDDSALQKFGEALATLDAAREESTYSLRHRIHLGLARIAFKRGALDQAMDEYDAAWAAGGAYYGDEHPEMAKVLLGVARVYKAQGSEVKADEFFKRAFAVNWRPDADLAPSAAQSYMISGMHLAFYGDDISAIGALKRSIEIYQRHKMTGSEDFAAGHGVLALAYLELGMMDTAKECAIEGLKLDQAFGGQSEDPFGAYWAPYNFFNAGGIPEQACDFFAFSLEVRQSQFDTDDARTQVVRQTYGERCS
ncbi:MAG: hypothetical protein H6684_04195 [Deltaproteobacteria bacterium]|nr:hypothetical protein [Deltaproteobacteria bacterium]